MTIRPVGVDRQTDMTKLMFAFCNFVCAPNKWEDIIMLSNANRKWDNEMLWYVEEGYRVLCKCGLESGIHCVSQ
jgi:hypothetical protein